MNSAAMSRFDQEGFAALLLRLRAAGIESRAIIDAIEATPRRLFAGPEHHDIVWGSRSIPIGCGTVIEGLDQQAALIDALDIEKTHRVLEIGTGSGYSAAVMGRLASRVLTIDRFARLQNAALAHFRQLNLLNVIGSRGDGTRAQADGPFDRIIIWPSLPAVPRDYLDLLVSGGKLICVVGAPEEQQIVARLTKVGSRFEREDIGTARFAPIVAGLPQTL